MHKVWYCSGALTFVTVNQYWLNSDRSNEQCARRRTCISAGSPEATTYS